MLSLLIHAGHEANDHWKKCILCHFSAFSLYSFPNVLPKKNHITIKVNTNTRINEYYKEIIIMILTKILYQRLEHLK